MGRHTHRYCWMALALGGILLASCAATGSPGRGGGRDSGGTGLDGSARDSSASRDSGRDSSTTPRDSAIAPRDSAPRIDAGCDLMTPVPTTIIGDPPDMLLIVDISGSMCTPLGFGIGGASKLSVMKAALTRVVTEKEARINFGMMLFPNSSGACAPGTVPVPIAPRNAAPINARLASLRDDLFGCVSANSGATPTPTSVDAARDYYGTIPVNPVGRYALLATDGLPNCGPASDGGGTAETLDETVAAIAALHTAGVTTYVVGFGSGFGSDPSALNRMATAGGTPRPFSAASAAALSAALDTIAAEVIPPSCTVELGGPTRDPLLFQVRFDGGALIPRDTSHARGWDYDVTTNTVTFYGSECTTVQSGSVTDVQIDFGCPGPLI
ncbi:MAG: VWA domain-containing protein [Deltaproteobacteria bacterium]|nr:VWA domain-containing protein [Deltaproteobacteria bacterium]